VRGLFSMNPTPWCCCYGHWLSVESSGNCIHAHKY
jgi:hypothetical protein